MAAGGGPFGALVVTPDGQTHEGVNHVTRDNDPTAHAEVVAIRTAAAARTSLHDALRIALRAGPVSGLCGCAVSLRGAGRLVAPLNRPGYPLEKLPSLVARYSSGPRVGPPAPQPGRRP